MLFRDIVEKNSIKKIQIAECVLKKPIMSYTQNISINKWFNDFKSMGLRVSKDTLYLFIKYFEDSFYFLFKRNQRGQ